MGTAYTFIGGLLTMGFTMGGFYFLKFWRRTRDSVFLSFGAAFLLLAFSHAMGAFIGKADNHAWSYLPRLLAFLLIITAIVSKNLGSSERSE
ncbi:MAG: DUF5985 family protein [Alphaproteobacteria bacterium]